MDEWEAIRLRPLGCGAEILWRDDWLDDRKGVKTRDAGGLKEKVKRGVLHCFHKTSRALVRIVEVNRSREM